MKYIIEINGRNFPADSMQDLLDQIPTTAKSRVAVHSVEAKTVIFKGTVKTVRHQIHKVAKGMKFFQELKP